MTVEREKAARMAAAKHSNNLAKAVIEYATLTGQISSGVLETSAYNNIRDEMLSLLKPYRHPANDEYIEQILFFDPDGIRLSGTFYEIPDFVRMLEEEGVSDHLLTEIKEYIRISGQREKELAQCKNELNDWKTKISEAKKILADTDTNERSEARNSAALIALGLSKGTARKRFDNKRIWHDYVTFVRKEGMSLSGAIKKIKKKHKNQSEDTIKATLHEQRASLLEKIAQQFPSMYDEATKLTTGFVPDRRK